MSFFSSRLGSILFLILTLTVATATPADALEVSVGDREVTLTVGDSLFVTRDGLMPDRLYRAVVTDEVDFVVADVLIKAAADLGPALVWPGAGVVGCDLGSNPDPRAYRFARIEEAEGALKDRTFQLIVLDEETQTSLARIALHLDAAEENLLYLSDALGCPRCLFGRDEPVYLSGQRVTLPAFWLSLVKTDGQPPEVGDLLDDVRGGPQEIKPTSSYFTERVIGGLEVGTIYAGAIHSVEDVPTPPGVLTVTGIVLAPAWRLGGCERQGIMRDETYKPDCGPAPVP